MPVYVLYGTEAFARGEALGALRAELDTDGSLATNTVMLDAASSSPQEVMAACDTAPFLGERRLVVVTGALSQAGKVKRPRRKADDDRAESAAHEQSEESPWLALVEYLPRLPESTVLVFVDSDAPAGALLRALEKTATIRRFAVPNDKELPGWIMTRAREMDVKIEPSAAKLLADLVGTSGKDNKVSHIPMIVSELEKLGAYANGEPVRARDVSELVGRAKEHMGWELTSAIIDGKGATAAKVLQELIEDGGVLPVLLSTVAGRYRRIAIAKDIVESGGGEADVRRALNTKPGLGHAKADRGGGAALVGRSPRRLCADHPG